MNCPKCAAIIPDDSKKCPYCDCDVAIDVEYKDVEPVTEPIKDVVEEKEPAKVWTIFAKLSKILGIVAVATCWLPGCFSFGPGVPALVFSILGKKAQTEETAKQCKTGLTLAIIGLAVGFVAYIVWPFISVAGDIVEEIFENIYYY